MADTSLRISKDLVKRYDEINTGKFNLVKATFSKFAKSIIEREIEKLEKMSADKRKSA